MSVNSLLRKAKSDPVEAMMQSKFDSMFLDYRDFTPRKGTHVSSIITSERDFCLREHVLGYFYERGQEMFAIRTLRIFANGEYVHLKWQNLFKRHGLAELTERAHKSKMWDIYFTPDAVIRLFDRRFIVEIKSMNTYQFRRLVSPPSGALKQIQFYMFLSGIPEGIVIVEDKNTQEFKVFRVPFDVSVIYEFVERLYDIREVIDTFKSKRRAPSRNVQCKSSESKRAQRCGSKDACFGIRRVAT